MLQLGVDAHRALLVVVATDPQGRQLASWQGENTPHGWQALEAWAQELGTPRTWGIEGSGHYGRGLAQWLLARAEAVYEINPRWVAQQRRHQRQAAKNDLTDGLAIARLLGQEGAALPAVTVEDASTLVSVLTRDRQALLKAATRARNQLHVHLFQLDPGYRQHYPSLTQLAVLDGLRTLPLPSPAEDALGRVRVRSVQRLAEQLLLLSEQAEQLKAEIEALAPVVAAPLLTIRGVGLLTAGMLAGYLGPGQRFASDAQLAAYAGVAPPQPDRPAASQCAAPSHCPYPKRTLSRAGRLHRAPAGRRQDQKGGAAGTQTPHCPRGLATMATLSPTAVDIGASCEGVNQREDSGRINSPCTFGD